MGEVNADLMGAPRFESDLHQRVHLEPLGNSVMSHGVLAIVANREALAIIAVTPDRFIHRAAPGHSAMHQSQIGPSNGAILELVDQVFVSVQGVC